jgi:hypothetical protein
MVAQQLLQKRDTGKAQAFPVSTFSTPLASHPPSTGPPPEPSCFLVSPAVNKAGTVPPVCERPKRRPTRLAVRYVANKVHSPDSPLTYS